MIQLRAYQVALTLTLALLMSSALAAQDSNSGPPDRPEVRRFDMRCTLSAGVPAPSGITTALHQSSAWVDTWGLDSSSPDLGPEARLSPVDIEEVLALATGEAEGIRFEWLGGWLQVEAPASAMEAISHAVRVLRSVARESVEVDVLWLDDSRLAARPRARLAPEDAAALFREHRDALVCRAAVPLGRSSRLAEAALVSYLSDKDVEGWSALGSDPVVSVINSGLDLGVRVDRDVDGERYIVRIWGRDGGPSGTPAHQQRPGADYDGIERLTVPTSSFMASGVIPVGGGLLIDHDGGDKGALVLRIRSATDPRSVAWIAPLGVAAVSPLRSGPVRLPEVVPSGGAFSPDENPLDGWYGDLTTRVTPIKGATTGTVAQEKPPLYGSSAISVPGQDGGARLRELRSITQPRTVSLDVRFDLVVTTRLDGLTAGTGVQRFASAAAGRLTGSAREGESLVLVGGRERGYLSDLDSQISGGLTRPDPIVSSFFEGVGLWFAPLRSPNEEVTGWLHFNMRQGTEELRTQESPGFLLGHERAGKGAGVFHASHWIQLPRVRRANVRKFMDAPSGAWTLVSARPLAGSGKALVVVARMDAE